MHKTKGLFGGIKTTLSTIYVTPKWLVCVDSSQRTDAGAGTAQLKHIDVRDYQTTASYIISPDHGLNVTERYTDKNKTGVAFIMLAANADGQRFRKILEEALCVSRARK